MNGVQIFKELECSCGKQHQTKIEDIVIGEGVIQKVEDIIKKHKVENILVISDIHAYEVAGNQVQEILERCSVKYTQKIFQDENLIPDEKAIGEIFIDVSPQTDFIVVIGSGTLNDLGRFTSYQLGIPYIIVATAPSMDGFASKACPLIINNLKTTLNTHSPIAIIGDVDILKKAPYEMLIAGIGDLLGKYTCLCDWKISHIVNGEYYCEQIAKNLRVALDRCIEAIKNCDIRSEQVIHELMETLVLSGLCMEFVESSRPASGAEHHLSHLWEMIFMQQEKAPILHGVKVGVATVLITKIYNELLEYPIDFCELGINTDKVDYTTWCMMMEEVYGKAAKEVIKLEDKVHKNDLYKRKERIKHIEEKWEVIQDCIRDIIPKDTYIIELLTGIKAPYTPQDIGVSVQEVRQGIHFAKELRDRYTVLQLLWDLNMTEEMFQKLTIE